MVARVLRIKRQMIAQRQQHSTVRSAHVFTNLFLYAIYSKAATD